MISTVVLVSFISVTVALLSFIFGQKKNIGDSSYQAGIRDGEINQKLDNIQECLKKYHDESVTQASFELLKQRVAAIEHRLKIEEEK